MLFYCVYMRQTLPPFHLQTVFWGPSFPLRTACLFTCEKDKYFWVCIITSLTESILKIVLEFLLQNYRVPLSQIFLWNVSFMVFTSFAGCLPKCQRLCSHSKKPKLGVMRGKKEKLRENKGKRTDWMKSSIQTRVVTNREFYELQTCWNGVAVHVQQLLSARWQQGRVRASTLALRKNGLIHFPHERVSLGRHQTGQSTQIYGPLKQQASWPLCHHRLAAKTHCTLIHARSLLSITG